MYVFQKSKQAMTDDYVWNMKLPGSIDPLFSSCGHFRHTREKSMTNLPCAFHISHKKVAATYLDGRVHSLNKGGILCVSIGNQLMCHLHVATVHTYRSLTHLSSHLASLYWCHQPRWCQGGLKSAWAIAKVIDRRSAPRWKSPVIYSAAPLQFHGKVFHLDVAAYMCYCDCKCICVRAGGAGCWLPKTPPLQFPHDEEELLFSALFPWGSIVVCLLYVSKGNQKLLWRKPRHTLYFKYTVITPHCKNLPTLLLRFLIPVCSFPEQRINSSLLHVRSRTQAAEEEARRHISLP